MTASVSVQLLPQRTPTRHLSRAASEAAVVHWGQQLESKGATKQCREDTALKKWLLAAPRGTVTGKRRMSLCVLSGSGWQAWCTWDRDQG